MFGGVSALPEKVMNDVNGYSNQFWGWGGEDDHMAVKLIHKGYEIQQYEPRIENRWFMLEHQKDKSNPRKKDRTKNLLKILKGPKTWTRDGLSDLEYLVKKTQKNGLFTRFIVDIYAPTNFNDADSMLKYSLLYYLPPLNFRNRTVNWKLQSCFGGH